MTNKIVLILTGILVITISNGQQSINAGMIRWQQNDNVHQVSIGEMAIAQTFEQSGIVLTQGYLQPVLKIMSTAQKNYFADISINPYPNPFTSFLTVEMALNRKIKNIEISITDIIGQKVYHKKLPLSQSSYPLIIDLRSLSEGVYTLNTILNNLPHSSKLIQKF